MQISSNQIEKYQQIYFESFGETIAKDDALKQGLALVRLVKAMAKPVDLKNENNYEYKPAIKK